MAELDFNFRYKHAFRVSSQRPSALLSETAARKIRICDAFSFFRTKANVTIKTKTKCRIRAFWSPSLAVTSPFLLVALCRQGVSSISGSGVSIFRGLDLDFPKTEPRVAEGGVMIFRGWDFAFIERMETRFLVIFGMQLGCILDAFGMLQHCRRIWNAFGMQLGCILDAFGMHLGCVLDAFGMQLRRIWDAFWMHLGCIWDAL